MIIQRILEPLSIPGKGRLADTLLPLMSTQEVQCHPIRGVTVFLRTNQRIERWMWAGAYERELVRLMKTKLKPGMTVLDVGANIGYFSAIASGLVGDAGQVHAFEPMPDLFLRLQKNLSAFRWAHPLQLAVGGAAGRFPIYYNELESGWSSLLNSSGLSPGGEVEVIRLDDWLPENLDVNRIDFVKMDIEGNEFRALEGATETLARFKPTIAIELNEACLARDGRSPKDVLALLNAYGYLCTPFDGGALAVSR